MIMKKKMTEEKATKKGEKVEDLNFRMEKKYFLRLKMMSGRLT